MLEMKGSATSQRLKKKKELRVPSIVSRVEQEAQVALWSLSTKAVYVREVGVVRISGTSFINSPDDFRKTSIGYPNVYKIGKRNEEQ